MCAEPVRVRFAPSPTGSLHIGGVRTALFNWLIARHHDGRFLLRIEDTDRERSTGESERQILDGLQWLGLHWDEPPMRQSERSELYQRRIDRLLSEGHAYRCTATSEDLESMRQAQIAAGRKPMYDRRNRDAGIRADIGRPFVVRFKTPLEGERSWNDLVRGTISIPLPELDDFILQRSDGSFIYNFVVAVDDADMRISHVVRGEDHINNTPKQILLYEALGLPIPKFGHLPLILGSDKAPLSKRHGSTSLEAFRQQGYLPDALLNYLVRLGWGHGDQEVFSREEMIRFFSLDKVSKSGAVWNPDKLDWLNGHYLQNTPTSELVRHLKPLLPEAWRAKAEAQSEAIRQLVHSLRTKVKTLAEMRDQCAFWFEPPADYEETAVAKAFKDGAGSRLTRLAEGLSALQPFGLAEIEALFSRLSQETGVGLGKLAQPARVALTGRGISPGIYEVIAALGREESVVRLRRAIDRMG